eukprot:352401-Rhodomonas_salina.1
MFKQPLLGWQLVVVGHVSPYFFDSFSPELEKVSPYFQNEESWNSAVGLQEWVLRVQIESPAARDCPQEKMPRFQSVFLTPRNS